MIRKSKKTVFWITGLAGFFLILLVTLDFLIPKLIDKESIKVRIQDTVSREIGGKVEIHGLDLSILPRPHAVIHQTTLSIPENVTATLKTITVYPKMFPLVLGKLRVAKLKVEAPDINLRFPKRPYKIKDKKKLVPDSVFGDKVSTFLASLALYAPDLVVELKNGKINIAEEGKPRVNLNLQNLLISFHTDEDKTEVSLKELKLGYPQLKMTGELLLEHKPQKVSLELESKGLDVYSTRKAALALAGDIPITQEIFDIVKGGKIPEISFHSKGMSFAELDDTENFIIKGKMREGRIYVPGAGFDLKAVKGDVVISQGILQGKNLEAQRKNSYGRDGTLKLGLEGENAPFHLDIMVQTDLTQLPPLLKRLVKNEAFVKEITDTYDIKGKAMGRLVLGESIKSVKAKIDVSEFNLSARYQRIPYLLKINKGQFSYDGSRIGVQNLSGRLGKSSFNGLTTQIGLGKEPLLEILSAKSLIVLEEIYPWLSSFIELEITLEKLKSVQGTIEISSLNLKGPLLKPKDWNYKMTGEMKDIIVDSTLFRDEISVKSGNFESTEKKLSFSDIQAHILDAALNFSVTLPGYMDGVHKMDLTVNGELGQEATGWLSDFINLPPEFVVRSPLFVSQAHLVRDEDVKTSFKGNFAIQHGPVFSLDILWSPEELMINNLFIQDEVSRASFTLGLKEREFSLNFIGNLNQTTTDKIFLNTPAYKEWIKGDFRVHILKDSPGQSTFKGKLEGKNIVFPWKPKVSLTVNSISLDGAKNKVRVGSAAFTLGDGHVSLKGDVDASEDGFLFDLDISVDRLDWDTIGKALDVEDKENEYLRDMPVKGMVRLNSEYFIFKGFTWSPLRADITFNNGSISATVTEADLCGISFPGVLKVTSRNISMDFQPVSSNQDIESTIICLWDKKDQVTGNFDLQGKIMAKGTGETLANSLNGDVELLAREGRIYRGGLLAKIFAFLNITEIFRGTLPDMVREGFAYKSITASGDIQNSTLLLKDLVIDSPSMEIVGSGSMGLIDKKMDLKFLVAPLKTVDSITKKIPIVKDITGGNLVSIPLKVTGDFDNPEITYLSASAVGNGLLGVMKNILKVPVKIIEPVLPGKEENKKLK